jgi:hypothetical protein
MMIHGDGARMFRRKFSELDVCLPLMNRDLNTHCLPLRDILRECPASCTWKDRTNLGRRN